MKLNKTVWMALALAVAPAAFADPTSISTGVAPWAVNSNPAVVEDLTQISALGFTWIPNFGDARWVGPSTTAANYQNPGDGAAPGVYLYTLDLGTLMGGNGTFSLRYASDDIVGWSISMGSFTGGTTSCTTGICWGAPTAPFNLTGTFTAMTVLTATVTNFGTAWNPSGFIAGGTAQLKSLSAIPEPSTYAMLCLGAAAMAAARMRKNRA